MRRIHFITLLAAIVLIVAAFPAVSVRAGSLTGTVVVDLLNIRKAPRISYPVLGQVARGTQLTLIGRNAGGTWVQVSSASVSGWAFTAYIKVSGGEIGALPVTDHDISPFVTIVAFPGVSVRSGPSTSFPVIGLLFQGATVDVLGQDPKSVWLQVQTPFGAGWIQSQFTNVTGNLFAAPNTDDSVTPVAKNVNYRTNIRSAPSTSASVVYVLGYERYVTIIGVSPDGRWWKVSGPFGTGWVSVRLVLAIGNLNNVPVVSG